MYLQSTLAFYNYTTQQAYNSPLTALPTGRANPIVNTVNTSFASQPGERGQAGLAAVGGGGLGDAPGGGVAGERCSANKKTNKGGLCSLPVTRATGLGFRADALHTVQTACFYPFFLPHS